VNDSGPLLHVNANMMTSMLLRLPRYFFVLFAAAALACLASACDDGESSGGDDTGMAVDTSTGDAGDDGASDGGTDTNGGDDVSEDTEPPTFRDVRVTIVAPIEVDLDLNAIDAERTIPNETSGDALTVEVIDDDGELLPGQSATLRNGLWDVELPIEPAQTLRVRLTDEAGNSAVSENALVLLAHVDAFPGNYLARFYDLEQNVIASVATTVSDDGTYEITDNDTGIVTTGNWSLEGDTIALERTTSTDPDAMDSDDSTIEWKQVAPYYIDDTHVSTQAFVRTSSEEEGEVGTWEQTIETFVDDGSGTLIPERTVTVTLELNDDDTFTQTWTGTDHIADAPIERTRSGTWQVELSENYSESYGNFLHRVVESEDGTALMTPEDEFELFKVTPGHLLISPRIAM